MSYAGSSLRVVIDRQTNYRNPHAHVHQALNTIVSRINAHSQVSHVRQVLKQNLHAKEHLHGEIFPEHSYTNPMLQYLLIATLAGFFCNIIELDILGTWDSVKWLD